MAKNQNLNAAARANKDEFYTQLTDIEKELVHYWDHFEGKTVFCNCDDPFESQFFFYFAMKFNFFKLKKLIVTSYTGSPVQGNLFQPVEDAKPAYKVEINRIDKEPLDWQGVTEVMNELKAALGKNNSATVDGNTLSLLEGDGNYLAGDFRSKECVALLKQADIVVTNPPFSLFREYVRQLIDFDKKFLIIGNINCITYKEIFPLIMANKIWLGYGMGRGIKGFMVPETYELYGTEVKVNEHGQKIIFNKSCLWLTNLEHDKRNRPYDLVFSYKENPARYPKYDNYDAIEVSKTGDIPEDYFGVMGVPITFLDKYCPDQFEILGLIADKRDKNPAFIKGTPTYLDEGHKNYVGAVVKGKATYARILIRRREKDERKSKYTRG